MLVKSNLKRGPNNRQTNEKSKPRSFPFRTKKKKIENGNGWEGKLGGKAKPMADSFANKQKSRSEEIFIANCFLLRLRLVSTSNRRAQKKTKSKCKECTERKGYTFKFKKK